MKKVLLAVAVVAFFASCKKDYVCSCDIDNGFFTETVEENYEGLSKSEAEEAEEDCESNNDIGFTCTWSED